MMGERRVRRETSFRLPIADFRLLMNAGRFATGRSGRLTDTGEELNLRMEKGKDAHRPVPGDFRHRHNCRPEECTWYGVSGT